MQPYRALAFLTKRGIGPAELARRLGRSKTTWSRFLAGALEPKTGEPRVEIEELLLRRGIRVPRDLWRRERTDEKKKAVSKPQRADDGKEIEMQAQAMSNHARTTFKLFANPFDPDAMIDANTARDRLDDLLLPVTHQFTAERLKQAYLTAGFVAVSGEPGSGKSTLNAFAFRQAQQMKKIELVTPANIERRKLTAMHVAAEIIRQLSEQTVPRTSNARDALAAEILRQRYEQGERVALFIDEAHELPHDTIKDLKRYHELAHGFARLLAIVLVGQSELAQRFDKSNYRLREVIIRCQLIQLPPMRGQVENYLRRRFMWINKNIDDVFARDALRAIEERLALHDQQLPVLIGNVAVAAMNIAARRGNKQVFEDDVHDVWSMSPTELQEHGL